MNFKKGFTPTPIISQTYDGIEYRSTTKQLVRGFTLIEVLLVIALIAILAGVVIVAINPARQYGNAQNTQRRSDVDTILNAVHQYAVDNEGRLPEAIPQGVSCEGEPFNRICKTDSDDCTDLVDLTVLTNNEQYLVSMPFNPGNDDTRQTGYFIVQSDNGRVTVCAPGAYNEEDIRVTR